MSELGDVANRTIQVDACHPHPANYNGHGAQQVEDLRRSLRKFGQVRSIVVQDDAAGGYIIVAGEGLWTAARAEKFSQIKADVIPPDWPPAKVLAYLAADNELARQSIPDQAQLALLVTDLVEENEDDLAELAAGGKERLATLMGMVAKGLDAEDPDAPDQFKEFDEGIRTEYRCPKCGYEWSGKAR